MKILLVSISIEFPLANYCLAAQIHANAGLRDCRIELLDLDWKRLGSYEKKNGEIWRYLAHVDQMKPDLVGFSVYLWNHLATRELAAMTRQLFPSIQIVLGGPELATSEAAESWLHTGTIDIVVRGEGERIFEEVVARLVQGNPIAGIIGTSRLEAGRVKHEPERPPIADLSQLASPFLEGLVPPSLFDREDEPGRSARHARALLETYRGCYMQCSYCQWGNGSKARFAFPTDRVFREITWMLTHRVRAVFFVDAMFGYKKSTAMDILEFVVHEKRRLDAHTHISLYHNQDFFDPHLLDLYRDAGASVEIDLQSTNREVLTRLGRGRWFTDSFDRHMTAIREQHVPTSGAADLIIGIPGDNLESFESSVDFLLRRGMRVNLYQASVLPDTGWSRSAQQDGTVFSSVPPRAILKNQTFPLEDMIAARLIGHGTDLFNRFPRTAALLWRRWFTRPVELCRAVGETVFRRHGLMYGESHQYESVLDDMVDSLAGTVRALCPETREAEILVELLKFEGALAVETWAPGRQRITPTKGWTVTGDGWLEERPEFRRQDVRRLSFRFPIYELALAWDQAPDPALVERVPERPNAVLFFNDGRAQHFAIDLAVTDRLLQRFNGWFTVKEVLDNLGLHWDDMSPVWGMLSHLAASGVISPGRADSCHAPLDLERALTTSLP